MRKKLLLLTLSLFLVLGGVLFTGCSKPAAKPAFEFTGVLKLNSVDYHATVKGWDGDTKTLELTVDEMKGLSVEGTWSVKQGYGYYFNFSDAKASVVKVKYDNVNKEFYFNYVLDLGSVLGAGSVKFTYKADFTLNTAPDELWDFVPYDFYYEGKANLGIMVDITVRVSMVSPTEFVAVGTCSAAAVSDSKGTYVFDSALKQYTLTYTEYAIASMIGQTRISTYDDATKTYTISNFSYYIGAAGASYAAPVEYVAG